MTSHTHTQATRRVYTHLEREAALLADRPQFALTETAVAVEQDVAQRHALVALVQRQTRELQVRASRR